MLDNPWIKEIFTTWFPYQIAFKFNKKMYLCKRKCKNKDRN